MACALAKSLTVIIVAVIYDSSAQTSSPTHPPTLPDPTRAPTTPSFSPSRIPTVPSPSPTSYPSGSPTAPTINKCEVYTCHTLWYEPMDNDPGNITDGSDFEWDSTARTLDYQQGANAGSISDCPDVGKENDPCWRMCYGSIVRWETTIGYKEVSLTYSIDPWASFLPNSYCQISWSSDNKTWNMIDRKYDSDDEIINKREYLGENSWNKQDVYINITSVGGQSSCCYMADFTLYGVQTDDIPEMDDPTTTNNIEPPAHNDGNMMNALLWKLLVSVCCAMFAL